MHVYRLEDLARIVGGQADGPPTPLMIHGVAPIDEAGPKDISLAAEEQYVKMIPQSEAGAFLVGPDIVGLSRPFIRVAHPRLAFIKLLEAFAPIDQSVPGIHETAILGDSVVLGANVRIQAYVTIDDRAKIGDNVTLHAGVRIGKDVEIGANTIVYPNVVIRSRTTIGRNGIIHANAVIGSDGYGFVSDATGHHKVPHIGGVEIGDDVEIGAGVTVDRGTSGSTRIGRGTKIGNLSQVAHNVQIGEDCLIVGIVGLAGSCRLGDRVTVAGQVGFIGHLTVGDDATVAARSLVTKSVPPGAFVSGNPARPHKDNLRIQAAAAQMPELLREMKALQQRVLELEAQVAAHMCGVGAVDEVEETT